MTDGESDVVALRVVQAAGSHGAHVADVGMAIHLQDVRFRGYRQVDREVLGLTVLSRLAIQGMVFANNRNRFFAIGDTAAAVPHRGRVEAAVCA